MPQSKITLIGMENFLNPDHSVFEKLTLPEGIDKDTLIGAIILRCQEFELLYSSPDFMIEAVKVWGMKNYWTFDRWVKLINKEYDPLYNKDYHEEISDIHYGQFNKTGSGSSSGSDDHTRTDNLQHSEDYTRTDNLKTETDNTDTHAEKAYNDASMVDTTEDVLDGEVNQTGTQRNAGSGSDTGTQRTAGTFSTQDSNAESGGDSYTNTHNLHGYGNIGVTAAQTLFMKETEVAAWNMYEHMADLFASEFCLMIY